MYSVESYIRNYPKSLIDCERYLNDGSPSGFSKVRPVSSQYDPLSENTSFRLPIVRSKSLKIKGAGGHFGGVPIHPEVLSRHPNSEELEIVDDLEVIPTASVRTVKVVDSNFFIKLHFDLKIGRANRAIKAKHIMRSIYIQREFENSKDLAFGYLSELGHLWDSNLDLGCIVRSTEPSNTRESLMIPFFSLIATKDRTPLLVEFIKKKPENYGKLIDSILNFFISLSVDRSLLFEAQAQNLLVEIDSEGNFGKIIIRDFFDFFVEDSDYLRSLWPMQFYTKKDKPKYASFSYDFKLSRYVLEPIHKLLFDNLGFNFRVDYLKKLASLRQHTPEIDRFFSLLPKQYSYGYGKGAEIFFDGKPMFEKQEHPGFR